MTKLKGFQFKYRNHHGKESIRTIIPESLEFIHNPGFGYQPGWFLSGFDIDKKARRSFRLSHIIVEPRWSLKFGDVE